MLWGAVAAAQPGEAPAPSASAQAAASSPQAGASSPRLAASAARGEALAPQPVSPPQPVSSSSQPAAASPQPAAATPEPAASSAQPGAASLPALTAATRFAPQDLQADVAVLRDAFEALHPGLLRYNTPQLIDAAFAALMQRFSQPRSLAEAYLALSQFTATLRCGHTYANFYNQPRAIADALFRAPRLPFEFRWVTGPSLPRMIVTRSLTDDPRLPAGTEVLVINDVLAATVAERLMSVARADGANDAKRLALLSVQGRERIEAFDVYYPLLFPVREPRFQLVVRAPGQGAPQPLVVDALSADEQAARTQREPPAPDAPRFQFWVGEDGIAVLRMPTWALYNSTWDWRTFITQAFSTLVQDQVKDLVIDLRGNEGGLDVGHEIVRHLVTRPLALPYAARLVRYRSVPAELRPVLDTWDRRFYDWDGAAQPYDARYFRLLRDADDAPGAMLAPAAPHYAGRVWVLVGAANSSATFSFAQLVQQRGLGTLVGRPTGGNQRGINGGAFFFLRLPRTHIEIDLPLIGTFPAGDPPDSGLLPDLAVPITQEGIASGRDVDMDVVRARIALARKPLAAQ